MDRASAIRIIHSGRCPYLGDGRTNQPWSNRFLHRSTLLANESWTDRKGANDRDRGDLLFTIRLCSYSVLSGVTFSVAFASLVTRSGGRISRRRSQIRGLVT